MLNIFNSPIYMMINALVSMMAWSVVIKHIWKDQRYKEIQHIIKITFTITMVISLVVGVISGMEANRYINRTLPISNDLFLKEMRSMIYIANIIMNLINMYCMYNILKTRGWLKSNFSKFSISVMIITAGFAPIIILGYLLGDIVKSKVVDHK